MDNDRPGAACPGVADYGHGMNLTTVHNGACCSDWSAQYEPAAEPEAEAG